MIRSISPLLQEKLRVSVLSPLRLRNFSVRCSPHLPSDSLSVGNLSLFGRRSRIRSLVFRLSLFGDSVIAVPLRQPDGLARSVTQVIQLCPPCFAASDGLDIQDVGRMQREDSLDALVVDDSPDREALVDAPAFAGDYRAREYLRALLVAFFDAAVNVHYIAHLEVGYAALKTLTLYGVQNFSFH